MFIFCSRFSVNEIGGRGMVLRARPPGGEQTRVKNIKIVPNTPHNY